MCGKCGWGASAFADLPKVRQVGASFSRTYGGCDMIYGNRGLFAQDVIDMTDKAPADVKLNIGVPGRMASGIVERGTTVRQALARFGFNAGAHQIRGWAPGGDKESRPISLDDKIESDMTMLLLRPMVGRAAPEEAIQAIVRERLGAVGVRDILVQPYDSYDGEDLLRVTIVLDPASGRLDGDTAVDLIVALRRKLEELEDTRFPLVEYARRTDFESSMVGS
jgi:hypothetical protein